MTAAHRAMDQLESWPNLVSGPPRCAVGQALFAAECEVVHFHSGFAADLHLTHPAIERLRPELRHSSAIRLKPARLGVGDGAARLRRGRGPAAHAGQHGAEGADRQSAQLPLRAVYVVPARRPSPTGGRTDGAVVGGEAGRVPRGAASGGTPLPAARGGACLRVGAHRTGEQRWAMTGASPARSRGRQGDDGREPRRVRPGRGSAVVGRCPSRPVNALAGTSRCCRTSSSSNRPS